MPDPAPADDTTDDTTAESETEPDDEVTRRQRDLAVANDCDPEVDPEPPGRPA